MLAESAIAQGSSVAVPAPQPPTAGLDSSAAALDTEVQPLHAESGTVLCLNTRMALRLIDSVPQQPVLPLP